MLRLSRMTDYGILLLTQFVRDASSGMHNARDLSEATDLPLPTVSKVLKRLTRAGILTSHRGVQGGYSLKKSPRETSIAEVIGALEGPVALTVCSEGPGMCELEDGCPVRTHLILINKTVHHALSGLSLEALAKPVPDGLVALTHEEAHAAAARTTGMGSLTLLKASPTNPRRGSR